MSGIDERILAMKFDNKQFESGIETSLGSLDKFNKKLKLEGATKGLTDLDKTAKSFSLAGLASGVETIAGRFSALGIIGVTALQNITNMAVNAGMKLVSALTIDPLKTGLQEYETQMNSVQTILANTASKGTNLKQVNAALNELNTYADKTIYNFTEMTRNIGTFTAAGVSLETSTTAIKGIANLAAVSGSNSQQASAAMYQLSQALSSGAVKLQDWNSVVNAGMGGQVFQEALKETARVHGVKIDAMIKKEGSFRETLSSGWLTAKILTETLSKFTGDLTKEQIMSMGYTAQQADEIVKLGKTANDAATKVKTFTQLMETLTEAVQSGWAQSWLIVLGDFEEAKELFTSISDTLGEMIGDFSDARNEVLQGWKDLGGRKAILDAFANTFKALMSVVTPIGQAFKEIFPPITAKNLYDISVALKEFTAGLVLSEKQASQVKRIFKGFFSIFEIGRQALEPAFQLIDGIVGRLEPKNFDGLEYLARLGDFFTNLSAKIKDSYIFYKAVDQILDVVDTFKEKLSGLKASIPKLDFSGLFSSLIDAFKKLKTLDLSGFADFFTKIKIRFEPLGALTAGVAKAFGGLWEIFKKAAPAFVTFGSIVSKVFTEVLNVVSKMFKGLDFKMLSDGFNVGMLMMIALSIKRFIDSLSGVSDGAGGILGGFKDIIDGVTGSLGAMQSSLKAKTLLMIAGAIAILAVSLLVLSTIDSDKLTTALVGVTILFVELTSTMEAFSKMSSGKEFGKITLLASALILISVAVLILAAAVEKLSSLSLGELIKGLVAVEVLLLSLSATAKLMQGSTKGLISAGIGLAIFGGALHILVGVVEKLGSMDIETLKKGLVSVGVLCAELALFLKVSNFDGMGIKAGVGFVLIAAALKIMASAVGDFAKFDVASLTKGLLAISGVLLAVSMFSNMTGEGKLLGSAVALTIIAGAMLIFSKAIGEMGSMSIETLSKGLLTMAGALIIVVAALNALPPNTLASSAALVIVGAALVVISEALSRMGDMSVEKLVKGLLTMAGALIIIAAATNAMTGALPGAAAILIVSAALMMLTPVLQTFAAMSWGEIVKGLAMLAGVFSIFGIAGYLLAPVVPVILGLAAAIALFGIGLLAAGVGVLAFSMGLAALGVAFATAGTAITLGITAILGLIPVALTQLGLGIIALAGVIAQGAPAIVGAMVVVLMALISAIMTVAPSIITALVGLVMMLVDVLVNNVPKLVDSGMKLILGILKGIRDNIKDVVKVAAEIITEFIDGIAAKLPSIIDSGINLAVSFVNGIADGIRQNSSAMGDAGANLATAMIEGAVDGIAAGVGRVVSAAADMARRAFEAAKAAIRSESPSKDFRDLGMWSDQGMAIGLDKFGYLVEDSAAGVATGALDSMRGGLEGISKIISGNMDLNPTIRPVLDISDVEAGAKNLGSLFGTPLDISGSYARASNISTGSSATDAARNPNSAQFGGISMTQNNYSPKALSALEIYRNTQNQLSTIKEVIRNS